MMELSHSKPHSEMMEACVGSSHAHESLGRLLMLELVVFELQEESPLCSVQCQDGCASVKMVMNVCWPSKNQANETRTAMRNWVQLNSPIQFSIVELIREGRFHPLVVGHLSDRMNKGGREGGLKQPFTTLCFMECFVVVY